MEDRMEENNDGPPYPPYPPPPYTPLAVAEPSEAVVARVMSVASLIFLQVWLSIPAVVFSHRKGQPRSYYKDAISLAVTAIAIGITLLVAVIIYITIIQFTSQHHVKRIEKGIPPLKLSTADQIKLQRQLWQAVADGNVTVVEELLGPSYDLDVNWIDSERYKGCHAYRLNPLIPCESDEQCLRFTYVQNGTTLHRALLCNHTETESIVNILLRAGASVNIREDESGLTPLFLAAELGIPEIVQLLLEKGADVKASLSDGRSALSVAVKAGHVEVVKTLLKNGADVNSKLEDGTVLTWACKNAKPVMARILIENRADVNAKDSSNITALIFSADQLDYETAKLLLENGAEINHSDSSAGDTALTTAAMRNDTRLVQLLIENGANVNTPTNSGDSPLIEAAGNANLAVVQLLLNKSAEVNIRNYRNRTALFEAAKIADAEIATVLIKNNADPHSIDRDGFTPMMVAAEKGNFKIVQLLLNQSANVNRQNSKNESALLLAAKEGHVEIVPILLENGAYLNVTNTYGQHPLSLAAENGHTEVCKLLLDKGVEIDAVDDRGDTPLVKAVKTRKFQTVKLLLDYDADANARSNSRYMPLFHAAYYIGESDIFKALVEKGANSTACLTSGTTPLTIAAVNDDEDKVRFLLEHGADADAICYNRTALMFAARADAAKAAELLIDYGADVNRTDTAGDTSLTLAAKVGKFDVIRLLLERRSDPNVKNKAQLGALHLVIQSRTSGVAEPKLLETIKLLVSNGANIESRIADNETPLLQAISLTRKNDTDELVRLLLELKADVNAVDSKGTTALMLSSEKGLDKLVPLLLEYGANSTYTDRDGNNALIAAAKSGQSPVIKLLLRQGVDVDSYNNRNETALIVASRFGHLHATNYLLNQNATINWVSYDNSTALTSAAIILNADICLLLLQRGAELTNACDADCRRFLRSLIPTGYNRPPAWAIPLIDGK